MWNIWAHVCRDWIEPGWLANRCWLQPDISSMLSVELREKEHFLPKNISYGEKMLSEFINLAGFSSCSQPISIQSLLTCNRSRWKCAHTIIEYKQSIFPLNCASRWISTNILARVFVFHIHNKREWCSFCLTPLINLYDASVLVGWSRHAIVVCELIRIHKRAAFTIAKCVYCIVYICF